MKINKNKFDKYEALRLSGATNMFDLRTVEDLSGLSREEILKIMKDYTKYKAEFCDEDN